MGKIFKHDYSPDSLVPVNDRTVVDILTNNNRRMSLDWWKFDEAYRKKRPSRFAINYAMKRGDRSPFLRGFEFNKMQYEIIVDSKEIVPIKYLGYPFYDSDKMQERFMFEGTLEWFLDEFKRQGYKVPEIR